MTTNLPTTPKRTRAQRDALARITGAERAVALYEAMLKTAESFGADGEMEVDRLKRNLAEMDAELDDAIEACVAAGLEYEDVEDAAR